MASSIWTIVMVALARSGLPRLGHVNFFIVIGGILILAIVPLALFVTQRYSDLGMVFSYLSITYLFGLSMYTLQTLVYHDKTLIKRFRFLF